MYSVMRFNDEVFYDINLEGIKPYYAVSNYGTVINKLSGEEISQILTKDGYTRVSLASIDGSCKQFLTHRLVMIIHHPIENPENFEVNHIYGKKMDNRDSQLEWVTPKENIQHAFATGLNNNFAENSAMSKLTNDEVREICKLLEQGIPIINIANKFKYVDSKNIYDIIRSIQDRKAWNSISKDYNFNNRPTVNKFTDSQVRLICKMLQDGYNYIDILNNLGIYVSKLSDIEIKNYSNIISNIRSRNYYTHISNEYNFDIEKERYDQIFSNSDIEIICKMLQDGLSTKDILAHFNIFKSDECYEQTRHFVSRLRTRKIFTNISCRYSF